MTIAYLRVSTEKQDADNQREEIIRFAETRDIKIDSWKIEVISGKTESNDRKLGKIIKKLNRGDVLIISEMSRLGRLSFDAISILATCLYKGVDLLSVKENYNCKDNISSKILGIFSCIFSEMERSLISQRTKEALAKKKAEGVILGRPKGSSKIWDKLMINKELIIRMLNDKVSKTKIANTFGISRVTLYKFIAAI